MAGLNEREAAFLTEQALLEGATPPDYSQPDKQRPGAGLAGAYLAAREAVDAGRAPTAEEHARWRGLIQAQLGGDAGKTGNAGNESDRAALDRWLAAFAAFAKAVAELGHATAPRAVEVATRVGSLWAEHAQIAGAEGAGAVLGRMLAAQGVRAAKWPLVIFRAEEAAVLRQALASTATARRLIAEKLREAIPCRCGAALERTRVGAMTDEYRCASCDAGMLSEWHELLPLYDAAPELPPLRWVKSAPAPAGAPEIEPRALYVVSTSGEVAAVDVAAGAVKAKLALGHKSCTCGMPTSDGVVLGFQDGALIEVRHVDAGLARGAELVDGESDWVALAPVMRDGERFVAAVNVRGDVSLLAPHSFEVLDIFGTHDLQPTAMVGRGEHLIVASAQGYLRRFPTNAPERFEAFLATRDRAELASLCWLAAGGLVALTDKGEALFYDGNDCARMPRSLKRPDRRFVCVGPFDAERAVLADDGGGVWLSNPLSGVDVELGARLERGIVALCRRGDNLFATLANGAVIAFPVTEAPVAPQVGRPRRLVVGGAVRAAFG